MTPEHRTDPSIHDAVEQNGTDNNGLDQILEKNKMKMNSQQP